jgi:hypothetical protein
MSPTLRFADEVLEAEFRHHLFLRQRRFCRDYHCVSAAMSVVAFACLVYDWSAGPTVSKLLVQAATVLLCTTALHLILNQPMTFSSISQPWHIIQRLCVCMRCCNIRSTWFMVPNQTKLLQPAFSLQFFFGTLVLPSVFHVFGLPLPPDLDALSAAAMLVIMWINNASFCGTMAKQDEGSMWGVASVIEGWVTAYWHSQRQHVPVTERPSHAVTCQAKLGLAQAATLGASVITAYMLEVYRRHRFLVMRSPDLPGALHWPLASPQVMSGIMFDAVLLVAGLTCLCEAYLWYLAHQ